MKKLILLSLTLGFIQICKAQHPVLPIYRNVKDVENAYYKDLDHDLQKCVGTWLYQDGQERFKIILKFKPQHYFQFEAPGILENFYSDALYGEYQYIDENGVEQVNSLANVNINFDSISEHLLFGIGIKHAEEKPPCTNCASDERIVRVRIQWSGYDYFSEYLYIRHRPQELTPDGPFPERLEVTIYGGGAFPPTMESPVNFVVPPGNYILTKME